VSTADPTRVHKPARERCRPGHRGDPGLRLELVERDVPPYFTPISGEPGDDSALE
jgi:hypothetical protein